MCSLLLWEKFPNLFSRLDLTKEDRTLVLREEPPEFCPNFISGQVIQAMEKALRVDKRFHSQQLQSEVEDQRAL